MALRRQGRQGSILKIMEIICNYNETTGDITCTYPDSYNVISKEDGYFETIDAGGGENFVVQKFVSYGDLMVSLFLLLILLVIITKEIFYFWLSKSVRFKKYEL